MLLEVYWQMLLNYIDFFSDMRFINTKIFHFYKQQQKKNFLALSVFSHKYSYTFCC